MSPLVREERAGRSVLRSSVAAPAVGLGALLAIIGTFLEWGSADTTGTNAATVQGFSFPDGRLVMGIGFALLIMALAMWMTRRVDSWFDSDLMAVALSTIATVVICTTWADIATSDRSGVSASPEIGLYVSLAGAVIAWIGSLAGLFRSRSDRASEDSGRVGTRRRAA